MSLGGEDVSCCLNEEETLERKQILYIRKAAAVLTVTHQNRFWAVYAPASYS